MAKKLVEIDFWVGRTASRLPSGALIKLVRICVLIENKRTRLRLYQGNGYRGLTKSESSVEAS